MFIVNFYNSLETIHQALVAQAIMVCMIMVAGYVSHRFGSDAEDENSDEKSSSKATLL